MDEKHCEDLQEMYTGEIRIAQLFLFILFSQGNLYFIAHHKCISYRVSGLVEWLARNNALFYTFLLYREYCLVIRSLCITFIYTYYTARRPPLPLPQNSLNRCSLFCSLAAEKNKLSTSYLSIPQSEEY